METWRCNVRFRKEKERELETKVEILTKENGALRESLAALDAKNRQIFAKLEKLMKDTTSLSAMDFKIGFDCFDRTVGAGKLLEEIAKVRKAEIKNLNDNLGGK